MRIAADAQNQRVIQTAPALQYRSTSGTAPENLNLFRFAGWYVHFRFYFVGIADNDERFRGFPKSQNLFARLRVFFAPIQKDFVTGEVFRGRRERQVKESHHELMEQGVPQNNLHIMLAILSEFGFNDVRVFRHIVEH